MVHTARVPTLVRGAAARVATAALGVGVVVLTAGCGEDGAPASVPSHAPGPADAYLDAVFDVTEEEAARRTVGFEESIAACMSEQGFEYVPDTGSHVSFDPAAIDPPVGSREFAAQWGYGFAAAPEGMRSTSEPAMSPNEELQLAMTPEEAEAWAAALWGSDPEELGGCYRAARNEFWGDVETDPVRAALVQEIERIDTEVAPADAAVVAAASAWADCMADAGFPGFTDPADAEESAWDAWMVFNGEISADAGVEVSDGEIAGQGDIAEREAALATADWDCRAEVGYDDVWHEVRDRFQQEYVDAHLAELEAWLEALT